MFLTCAACLHLSHVHVHVWSRPRSLSLMMRAHVVSVYKAYSYSPDRPSSEDILLDSQDPQMSTAAAVLMSSQGSVLGPASAPAPLVLYPWVLWQRKLTESTMVFTCPVKYDILIRSQQHRPSHYSFRHHLWNSLHLIMMTYDLYKSQTFCLQDSKSTS